MIRGLRKYVNYWGSEMAFDPDSYISSKTSQSVVTAPEPGGFNPDRYLAQRDPQALRQQAIQRVEQAGKPTIAEQIQPIQEGLATIPGVSLLTKPSQHVEAFKDSYLSSQAASYLTLLADWVPSKIRGFNEFKRQVEDGIAGAIGGEEGLNAYNQLREAQNRIPVIGKIREMGVEALDKSGQLRSDVKSQLIQEAREKGGLVGAGVSELSESIIDTLITLMVFKAVGLQYGGKGAAGKSVMDRVKQKLIEAPIRSAIMTASREGLTLKERAMAWGIGTLYQATPALSGLTKGDWSAKFIDIGLNTIITAAQWDSMIDNAYAQAEASGNSGDAGFYLFMDLLQAHGSDVAFGAMTKSMRLALGQEQARDAVAKVEAVRQNLERELDKVPEADIREEMERAIQFEGAEVPPGRAETQPAGPRGTVGDAERFERERAGQERIERQVDARDVQAEQLRRRRILKEAGVVFPDSERKKATVVSPDALPTRDQLDTVDLGDGEITTKAELKAQIEWLHSEADKIRAATKSTIEDEWIREIRDRVQSAGGIRLYGKDESGRRRLNEDVKAISPRFRGGDKRGMRVDEWISALSEENMGISRDMTEGEFLDLFMGKRKRMQSEDHYLADQMDFEAVRLEKLLRGEREEPVRAADQTGAPEFGTQERPAQPVAGEKAVPKAEGKVPAFELPEGTLVRRGDELLRAEDAGENVRLVDGDVEEVGPEQDVRADEVIRPGDPGYEEALARYEAQEAEIEVPKEAVGTVQKATVKRPAKPKKQAPEGEAKRRVRLGRGPQGYEVVRELPREKGDLPDEKFLEIRNEKTGEMQIVEARDITDIKAKAEPRTEASIDDSVLELERQVEQARQEKKAGFVDVGDSDKGGARVGYALRRVAEKVVGTFRAFGAARVSDKKLADRLDLAYAELSTAVDRGIRMVQAARKATGQKKWSQSDGARILFSLEETGAASKLPDNLRPVYEAMDTVRKIITDAEKTAGVLKEEFPASARRAITDEIRQLQETGGGNTKRLDKLEKDLEDLDRISGYLPHDIVARRVMEAIYSEMGRERRTTVSREMEQFFRQRKGKRTLRDYFDAGILKPQDVDLGMTMMRMTADANRRIALAGLSKYATGNEYVKVSKERPGEEYIAMRGMPRGAELQIPGVKAKAGEQVWVHRLLADGLQTLGKVNAPKGSLERIISPLDRFLAASKVGQFFNPRLIWAYNEMQRAYGGAYRWAEAVPVVGQAVWAKNLSKAFRDVMTGSKRYDEALKLGVFQEPEIVGRATAEERMQVAAREMRDDLVKNSPMVSSALSLVERSMGKTYAVGDAKRKTAEAIMDTMVLAPLYRSIANVTWVGDRVQRQHTYNNLIEMGWPEAEAAAETARIHGAYSKLSGTPYKELTKRLAFVQAFRLLMPIQTVRSYSRAVKLGFDAITGKDVPMHKVDQAVKSLLGTIVVPTVIDSLLVSLGWEPVETEKEMWTDKLRTRLPGGKYRISWALPNWKYKKEYTNDKGEKREVVLGVNNIVNMMQKWMSRGRGLLSGGHMRPEELDSRTAAMTDLIRWEVNPFWRNMRDIWENESSWGERPPRGDDGKDMGQAIGYFYRHTFRMANEIKRRVDKAEGNQLSYEKSQERDMKLAMNGFEQFLFGGSPGRGGMLGYSYTRSDKNKRAGYMVSTLGSQVLSQMREISKTSATDEERRERQKKMVDLFNARVRRIKELYSVKIPDDEANRQRRQMNREMRKSLKK